MLATRTFYKEILQTIGLVLISFILLMVSFDGLDQMRFLGRADYTWKTLVQVVFLNAPDYIYRLLPICTLIGGVLALSNMAARSELIAWRASGLSVGRMVLMVAGLGVLLAMLVYFLGEAGIASAEQKSKSIKNAALHSDNYFKQQDGYWNKQVVNAANGDFRFVNVRTVTDGKVLGDVRLYDFSEDNRVRALTFAKSAVQVDTGAKGQWQLHQVRHIEFTYNASGVVVGQTEQKQDVSTVDLGNNTLETISNRGQSYISLPLSQLRARVKSLQAAGQRSREYEVGFWLKLFYPVGIVVMLLLALPFAFMQTRKGGVGARVMTGIFLGLLFFILTAMVQFLGPLLNYPAPLIAGSPIVLFLSVAMLWLWRVTRVK